MVVNNYCLSCGTTVIRSDEVYCIDCRKEIEADYDLLEHVFGEGDEEEE